VLADKGRKEVLFNSYELSTNISWEDLTDGTHLHFSRHQQLAESHRQGTAGWLAGRSYRRRVP